ncbi:MAG: PEP-CTERM sorting domain-containing protein [Chthoniobacter sp.]|nr:PEP-CTERM sorting domain-containing protein [Chthoniobacter sp.]
MKRAFLMASLVLTTRALAEPAIITIQPQLVFESSNVLTMEIGGRTPGPGSPVDNGYDKLVFTSLATPQVTWGGTLNVALINSFAPVAGDVFDLFDFDAARDAGSFATLNLPTLSTGLLWNSANLYTDGTLRIALDPAFPGRVWDGGGADNHWTTNANWSLDTQPLNNGTAALTFAGGVRLAPNVDAAWNVAALTFDNTAGAFSIGGPQTITVGAGGVTNNDADPQTITAAVALGADASFTAAAGALSLASVALGGNTLTVTGANATTIGSTSGAGAVAKSGAGTLDLTGAQSFDTMTATAGTTNVNGALGSGAAAVNVTGAGTALKFGSVSQTLGALSIGAGATVTFTSGVASFGSGVGKSSLAAASDSAVVPESGSLGLLMVGVLGLLGRRRRI